jgi:hypothetical protein
MTPLAQGDSQLHESPTHKSIEINYDDPNGVARVTFKIIVDKNFQEPYLGRFENAVKQLMKK